jgi:replicative DNA helicase
VRAGIWLSLDDPRAIAESDERMAPFLDTKHVHLFTERWREDHCPILSEAAAEIKPTLIVVDTLIKTVPAGRGKGAENDAGVMNGVIERFTDLAAPSSATVWLIHHTNKGGEMRGSSAIDGACQQVLSATKDQKGVVTLDVNWKYRSIDPIRARFDEESGRWEGITAEEGRRADLRPRIQEALREGAGTAAELAKRVGRRAEDVRAELDAMVADGTIAPAKKVPPAGGSGAPRSVYSAS